MKEFIALVDKKDFNSIINEKISSSGNKNLMWVTLQTILTGKNENLFTNLGLDKAK